MNGYKVPEEHYDVIYQYKGSSIANFSFALPRMHTTLRNRLYLFMTATSGVTGNLFGAVMRQLIS